MSGCKVGPLPASSHHQPPPPPPMAPPVSHSNGHLSTGPGPSAGAPTTPRYRVNKWKLGKMVMMACKVSKVFSLVSRKWEPRPQSVCSEESVESQRNDIGASHSTAMPSASLYQQSSTRRLAFGVGVPDGDAPKKQLHDFYNNTTLSNVSKIFCAVVLLTAFFLVMTKSFNVNLEFGTSDSSRDNTPRNFSKYLYDEPKVYR